MRSDAQPGECLPFEKLRAVSLSTRWLINFGSGLIIPFVYTVLLAKGRCHKQHHDGQTADYV